MRDAMRDHPRLPRPRAGEDQERPFDVQDRFLLGLREERRSIQSEKPVSARWSRARSLASPYSTVTLFARFLG